MIDTDTALLPPRCEKALETIQRTLRHYAGTPFEIRLWGGDRYRFGRGEPSVKLLVNDSHGLDALVRLDELRICEAYMEGSLDVAGDMLAFASLRGLLSDRHGLDRLWHRLSPLWLGRTRTDRNAIAAHYDESSEFYLQFLDSTRCYSQALFERDDEPLEVASRRKLDFALDACRLRAGDHVLDVGAGWGSFTEHAGARGVHVTSLTISDESIRFVSDLIRRKSLPCSVMNEDFLDYRAPCSYDAIVILGVMEHLPDYTATLRQCMQLLKPGGRVYLDASAFREKYSKPTFISRYVFPGDHAFFCLHEFLAVLSRTPMEVMAVHNDRRNYMLTCMAWARKLETARDEIVRRWGEALYRRFRLYLWGSAHAFSSGSMDAYRLVLHRP